MMLTRDGVPYRKGMAVYVVMEGSDDPSVLAVFAVKISKKLRASKGKARRETIELEYPADWVTTAWSILRRAHREDCGSFAAYASAKNACEVMRRVQAKRRPKAKKAA